MINLKECRDDELAKHLILLAVKSSRTTWFSGLGTVHEDSSAGKFTAISDFKTVEDLQLDAGDEISFGVDGDIDFVKMAKLLKETVE